jgi:hypothetical protein
MLRELGSLNGNALTSAALPQTAVGAMPDLKLSATGVVNDSNLPEKHVWRMFSKSHFDSSADDARRRKTHCLRLLPAAIQCLKHWER